MRVEMARLQIIGLRSKLMPTVRALHELGCVQIDNISEHEDLSVQPLALDERLIEEREELNRMVAKISGLRTTLEEFGQAPAPEQGAEQLTYEECRQEAQEGLDSLSSQVRSLLADREELQEEQSSLSRYVATLRKLLPFVPESAQDEANVFIGVLVNRAQRWVLSTIDDAVIRLSSGRAETASGRVDEDTYAMVIVTPQAFQTQIDDLLGKEDLSRLKLPDEVALLPPGTAIFELNQRLQSIEEELEQAQRQLASLATTWLAKLRLWHVCLSERLEEIEILDKFGQTEQAFVLSGWTPESNVDEVRQGLKQAVGGDAQVIRMPTTPEQRKRAPVMLKNPAPTNAFESLVRLLRLPRYEGVDPTVLMSIFLPLFFGMILGDAGYGALLLLMCFVALRYVRESGMIRDLLKILALGAGWSIVFGFLYGELFGTLGEQLGLGAIWLHRGSPEEVVSLLLFTIAVGGGHILLGLVVGMWAAFRDHDRHKLLERAGMFIGLAGLFLMASVIAEWLPENLMTPGVVILLVGIALFSGTQGWIGLLLGPIEFIGLIGNVLSYLRIAAVGLASVYVARLANELAGSLGSLAVGLIVAILFHALNIALGAFSPTIHSMRLHYVEFFRTFYEGGGRPFEPFKRSGALSRDQF